MSSSSASAAVSETAAAHSGSGQPPQYRAVGIILAVSSGVLIGSSFVFKKKASGCDVEGGAAGEGVAYLKSPLWWTGMIMMIIGELCNFGAYAFVEAIIVTPLGALSVVICAILSSIFLKEKLTFFGWIGCIQCIIGSIVIALNAPEEQSVTTIAGFKHLFLAPGFLSFGSVVIVAALVIIFFVAPKYGKQSMLWYILVCSLIGGLSVSCTQGLGASIVTSIRGDNQFKNWFIYFLLVFVVITLLTEIYYLNVALALFNTAMVTPTYYVIFTFCTLVTSVILYQGLHATVTQILTVVLGFLMICTGITILQMSKVDPRKLKNLDRRTTLLLAAAREEVHHDRSDSRTSQRLRRRNGAPTEHGEYGPDLEKLEGGDRNLEDDVLSLAETEEPGMDALRGGFGAVGTIARARRRSTIGRARRNTVTSQTSSGRGPSEDAGHAGIGTKRFREATAPPLPGDSAVRIEAAKRVGGYGPSMQSASVGVGAMGDLRDEPALRMMDMGESSAGLVDSPGRTPDLKRGPSSGGVHFKDKDKSYVPAKPQGRSTPTPPADKPSFDLFRNGSPDPLRSGTPDPNNPGTYVLRVPAPAGSASAVPRRVTSPPLSRTPTPTRKDWKSPLAAMRDREAGGSIPLAGGSSIALGGAGASNIALAGPARTADGVAEDGDASRVPRLSSVSNSTGTGTPSDRAQPTVSEYFPPTGAGPVPAPSEEGESVYGDAVTGLAPPPMNRGLSGLARSDRATVAESTWTPEDGEDDERGGVVAGEVRTGRGVIQEGEGTVASEGVERGSADGGGSESIASSGHALLKRYR
ncbi:Magnesium transporter NIPA [Ceratobasidium sp. AG-Ba]|nr:Magnesium transporter NIPA [Ceratobasidium sp. AG-Ba]